MGFSWPNQVFTLIFGECSGVHTLNQVFIRCSRAQSQPLCEQCFGEVFKRLNSSKKWCSRRVCERCVNVNTETLGDSEYHTAPRLELWRQHPQLVPLLTPAEGAVQWTTETVRGHARFEEFVAFSRQENEDPSWEFDGDQEDIEAWAEWLTDEEMSPPPAAAAIAPAAAAVGSIPC